MKSHNGGIRMAKHRLQFDFHEEALQELDNLKAQTGLPTRAELIRHALRFLQWTFDKHQDGSTILVEKDGKTEEVVFPFWTPTKSGK
ncbi:MAG: ribbon-helix-helix protein, CopG family [Patescibacteria group bacterium]